MKTSAEIRTVHPAVAGQEPAAFTQGETVDLVVTEELGLAGGDQGARDHGSRGGPEALNVQPELDQLDSIASLQVLNEVS